MGTDPNRNFDFQWATVGSSSSPCSETFHGSEPFSEVETRNVRDFVTPLKDQLKHFIDVHSYSQIVITPWGYTSEVPDDWDEVGKNDVTDPNLNNCQWDENAFISYVSLFEL